MIQYGIAPEGMSFEEVNPTIMANEALAYTAASAYANLTGRTMVVRRLDEDADESVIMGRFEPEVKY